MSLSDAEASVAAPFTSKVSSVFAVLTLLREGRCALATSVQIFKFMACYSLIQFVSVLLLYSIGNTFGDLQFLWIDLVIILPLVFLMGRTEASSKLTRIKPSGDLLSSSVLVSVICQMIIMIGFQFGVFMYLKQQSWYIAPTFGADYDPSANTSAYNEATTTIFLFANFQYIMIAIAFSISKPFRKPIYTNRMQYLLFPLDS